MTARERIMIYILGGLVLGGLGYGAYTVLVKPIRDQNVQIEDLESQIENRQDQLRDDLQKNLRLRTLTPLTLPGNRELAEGEYETMLGRLLRDSKISGGKWGKQTQSETDPEPELVPGASPGKPGRKAYTKVNYSISFEKVTLAKLTDFLTRYNKVPLMHQIVKCSIKHAATGSGANSLKQLADERTDLTVTLVSEAVLLDGAPERRTLFAIPDTFGAALGGVALNALRNDTEKSRYLTPTPDAAYYAIATMQRDYDLLAARDPFHGPLPEYPKPIPKEKKKEREPEQEKPPYDHSPHIYLSSLVRTSEGGRLAAQLDVVDRWYDQFYTIAFSQFGDLLEVKVQRWTKSTKTDAKTKEVTSVAIRDPDHPKTGSVMEISDRASKPLRTFKVYGLVGNALILGEKAKVEAPKDDKAKIGGGRPVKGAKPPAVVLPKPEPQMIAVGGLGAVKDTSEKIYRWEVSSQVPLSQLKPLSEKDAKEAVEAAKKGLAAPPLPPSPPLTDATEQAPSPRVALN